MSGFDVLSFLLIAFITLYTTAKTGARLKLPSWQSRAIVLWHTGFCVAYWVYAQDDRSDATGYYRLAASAEYAWSPGTPFVQSFTAILVNIFGFSEMNVFLVYNLFGVLALLLLARMILEGLSSDSGPFRYLRYAVVFTPSLSFWSSAIGKDAPVLLASCLAVFAFLDIGARKTLFALAVASLYMLRPHVAALVLAAAGVALTIGRGVRAPSRLAMLSTVALTIFLVAPFVAQYVGLDESLTAEFASDYVLRRQTGTQVGGSAVDISSQRLPVQMFSYLFRPLPFGSSDLLGIVVSLENLLLLALCTISMPRVLYSVAHRNTVAVRFNAVYILLHVVIFSMTTANLGLAIRQKVMVFPSLFVLMALTTGLHGLSFSVCSDGVDDGPSGRPTASSGSEKNP